MSVWNVLLLLISLGAVATVVFVEHRCRHHGLGLRARFYGWAIGPALIVTTPLLLISVSYQGTCSSLDEDWACNFFDFMLGSVVYTLMFGGWDGLMLMLSLWTFLYLAGVALCWMTYRLAVPRK
jgi:hypothetical protein